MLSLRFHNRIGKTCALVAVTLILPALAYADNQNGANQNGTNQNGNPQNAPIVPEVNPVWVMIPLAGAVLLFSARKQFARRKG